MLTALALATALVSAAASAPPDCTTSDCGAPLNVSPLIAAGQLAEARQQLLVQKLGKNWVE